MIQRISDDAYESPTGTRTHTDAMLVGHYKLQMEPVHGAILHPASDREAVVPHPHPAPVTIRPEMPDDLFDRDDETEQALAALRTGEAVELQGPHGSGKTALMAHLSRNVDLDHYPDGVVYQRVSGQSAGDILQTVFAAFYDCELPYKPSQTELRNTLQAKRAVVMLDDVELRLGELERLMNHLPRCVFVVATIKDRLLDEGRLIPLPGLPLGDAVTLFEKELGERGMLPEEIPVVQRLCRGLASHPLHIRQAAALVRDDARSLAELADAIESPKDFDPFLLESLKHLSVSQRQILGVLATLEGAALTLERLTSITRVPNAGEVIEALRRRGLVESVGDRYRISCDVTEGIHEKVSPEWTIKLILYYRGLLESHAGETQRLLPDLEAIVRVMRWVVGCGLWADALAIARRLEAKLAISGQWDAWGEVLEAGLVAARKLEDRREEAWLLHQQGVRAVCLGNAHTAKKLLTTALDMRVVQGDTPGSEATRRNLVLVNEAVAESPDPFEAAGRHHAMSSSAKAALAGAAVIVLALFGYALFGGQSESPTAAAAATPLAIAAFDTDSPQIVGGESATAIVRLNRAVAGADETTETVGRTIIDFVSSDPALAEVPRTITVAPGESEATLPIKTQPVAKTERVKLTATHAGVGGEITVTLKPDLAVELDVGSEHGGRIVEFTVRSKAPAPPGGLVGKVNISRPEAVKGPATVLIPAGEQQTTVELETLPVSTEKQVDIAFAYEDLKPRATLTVRAGAPLLLTPPSILGGEPATATVVLGYPAPAGGTTFAIAADKPLLQTPETVTVPEGEFYARFDIASAPVGKAETVVLTGKAGDRQERVRLRLRPQFDFRVDADPDGSDRAIGVVTMQAPVPADARLWLTWPDEEDGQAWPVRLRPGQKTARFPINARAGERVVATYDGVQRKADVGVPPPANSTPAENRVAPSSPRVTTDLPIQFDVEPREVIGGDLAVATLTLDAPAPSDGAFVELTSDNRGVVVPAITKVPPGKTGTQFVIATEPVSTKGEARITAARGETTRTASLVVQPRFDLTVERASPVGGGSMLAAVRLAVPAPPEGATFELVSRDPDVLNVPSHVAIEGGEDAVPFEVRTAPVPAPREVGLTARYQGVENSILITLQVDFQITLDVDPEGQVTGAIRLSGPAPEGGAVVELKSNAPRAVEVPSSVTIPAGEDSASFPITLSGPPQTVTIVGTWGELKRPVLLTY